MEPTLHDRKQPEGLFSTLILPDASRIFLDRSLRFATLAGEHSLGDWLSFLGHLTRIQHELLLNYPPLSHPDGKAPAFEQKPHLPPIPASSWPRDLSWRQALAEMARGLGPHAPGPARKTLEKLRTMDAVTLESLADRVLRLELEGRDAELLPFVAAALQVYWTALASGLDQAKAAPSEITGVCPCCGFLPLAGIIRADGEVARLRYLHCALCNTQWHLVRVTCASCRDSNSIAYFHIESGDESVRAETCDACRSYLKIVNLEKSPQGDPVADDLATLALDLLVQEAGYYRTSPNLLFAPSRGR